MINSDLTVVNLGTTSVSKPLKAKQVQTEVEEEYFEVEKIEKHKIEGRGEIILLIKWKGYGEQENTWEPLKLFYKDAKEVVEKYFKEKGF